MAQRSPFSARFTAAGRTSPGQAGKRQQEERYKVQGLAVIRSARGARHPEMATQHNNLAVMKARRGDWPGAATDMERAVAIMLSLALSEHDSMPSNLASPAQFWRKSHQPDEAVRLQAGNISDLLPVIAQIEAEHHARIAEDPPKSRLRPAIAVREKMSAEPHRPLERSIPGSLRKVGGRHMSEPHEPGQGQLPSGSIRPRGFGS